MGASHANVCVPPIMSRVVAAALDAAGIDAAVSSCPNRVHHTAWCANPEHSIHSKPCIAYQIKASPCKPNVKEMRPAATLKHLPLAR